MLTRNTKTKLAQLESYDNQTFDQYKQFLILTTKDPAFMSFNPLVNSSTSNADNKLIQFQNYWNAGYFAGTSWDDMKMWAEGPDNGYWVLS
jgi:hypothetical protein